MMSSILNSDLISVRLMVQGMSLEKGGRKKKNKKMLNGKNERLDTCCVEPGDCNILHV